jgi:copper transport protein
MRLRYHGGVERPFRYACLYALVLLVALAIVAPAAQAHSHLESSVPAAHAVLDSEPDDVTLTFVGNVQAAYGDSLRVVDPDGTRVDSKATIAGGVVTIPVDADKIGTYWVDYRIVSEDGHPTNGSFTFSVGATSKVNTSSLKHRSDGNTMAFVYDVGRAFSLLCVLIVAGSGIFALAVVPGWRPTMMGTLLVVGILASVVTFCADVALASGLDLKQVLVWDALRNEASTPLGRGMVIRVALELIALLFIVRRITSTRARPQAFVLGATLIFVLLAATQSLTGHALDADSLGLRLPLAMAHSAAAAIWVGGLVQFRMYVSQSNVRYDEVSRFSRMVLCAVVVLVVTGAYAAWREIGLHPADLTGTMYGRVFLLKIGLFASAIPLAMINRSSNLPEVERGSTLGPMHLRRYVRAELLILAAIIAVTVWLVHTPPPS